MTTDRAAKVQAEIAALAIGVAKTAWGEKRGSIKYENLAPEAREILEECATRGIHLGMNWGTQ